MRNKNPKSLSRYTDIDGIKIEDVEDEDQSEGVQYPLVDADATCAQPKAKVHAADSKEFKLRRAAIERGRGMKATPEKAAKALKLIEAATGKKIKAPKPKVAMASPVQDDGEAEYLANQARVNKALRATLAREIGWFERLNTRMHQAIKDLEGSSDTYHKGSAKIEMRRLCIRAMQKEIERIDSKVK